MREGCLWGKASFFFIGAMPPQTPAPLKWLHASGSARAAKSSDLLKNDMTMPLFMSKQADNLHFDTQMALSMSEMLGLSVVLASNLARAAPAAAAGLPLCGRRRAPQRPLQRQSLHCYGRLRQHQRPSGPTRHDKRDGGGKSRSDLEQRRNS